MGFSWKAFGHIALQIAPMVLMVAGVPPALAVPISKAIGDVQGVGGTGKEKKAAVMQVAVDLGANATELEAIDKGIDTAVAVVHTVHDAHGEDVAAALTPAPTATR